MKPIRFDLPTVLFWGTAVLFLFCYLGALPLWGSENRWAEVVREMRLTGDYFHPRINGALYFDKPLLGYWLIALVAAVTGRLDEAITRVPSALAGLLALGATMSLSRRLAAQVLSSEGTASTEPVEIRAEREARTAGWILLAMWAFLFWARTAEADMENMTAVILAVAWYWARRDKPGFVSYLVFYLICFVGAQTKGMAAIAVPILVVLPDMIKGNRWKSYISISNVAAFAVGLVIYVSPLAYADVQLPRHGDGGLWLAIRENIVRYFRPFDHKERFYVYFGYLPELLLPWTPLFVASLWRSGIAFRKSTWPAKWLTLSVVLIFMFFTVSGSRRSYYILPIVPFCAILTARFLAMQRDEKWDRIVLGIQTWLVVGIALVEVVSIVLWPAVKSLTGFVPPKGLPFVVTFLGLVALIPLLVEKLRPGLWTRITGTEPSFSLLIVMSAVILGGYFCWINPMLAVYEPTKSFSLEMKSRIGAVSPDDIAFYRKIPNDMLFYLDVPGPTQKPGDVESLRAFLDSQRKTKVLISLDDYEDDLAKAFHGGVVPPPTLKEESYPWEKESKYEAWIIQSDPQ
jgi:4-amino-4-deoxy-L-arabinose transferase-like glycosyltransferase